MISFKAIARVQKFLLLTLCLPLTLLFLPLQLIAQDYVAELQTAGGPTRGSTDRRVPWIHYEGQRWDFFKWLVKEPT